MGETEPYPGIELDQWFDKNGVMIKYMSRENMKPSAIKGNILEINPHILYLNSLFSKLYTLVPLTMIKKIPVVIAPRGMFGAGALEIKAKKKKIFLQLAKFMRLYKRVVWHASTIEEEKEIKKVFGKNADIVVAQNIPTAQQLEMEEIIQKEKQGLRASYLSAVLHEKKIYTWLLRL